MERNFVTAQSNDVADLWHHFKFWWKIDTGELSPGL